MTPSEPARAEIERFLAHAYESTASQVALARVGNDEHHVATFARAQGFAFTGEELAGYIAAQLDARLDEQQKEARGVALRLGPQHTARPERPAASAAVVRRVDAGRLERGPLFAGEVALVSGSREFAALAECLRAAIEAAFGAQPAQTLANLDAAACFERVQALDAALAADPRVPRLVADLIESLGWPARDAACFGPLVRFNLPKGSAGADGYFARVPVRFTSRHDAGEGGPALMNGHRDTWFGAPFHQVNLWAPLYPYPRGSGLVLMPSLFAREIANNTTGFDVWRAALGYAVGPMCLESLEGEPALDAALAVGDFGVFSANHFHGTGINPGPSSRISMELRVVCDEDAKKGARAPNVDFHGVGELSQFRRLG